MRFDRPVPGNIVWIMPNSEHINRYLRLVISLNIFRLIIRKVI